MGAVQWYGAAFLSLVEPPPAQRTHPLCRHSAHGMLLPANNLLTLIGHCSTAPDPLPV